jgi:hypothetical protein
MASTRQPGKAAQPKLAEFKATQNATTSGKSLACSRLLNSRVKRSFTLMAMSLAVLQVSDDLEQEQSSAKRTAIGEGRAAEDNACTAEMALWASSSHRMCCDSVEKPPFSSTSIGDAIT